MVIFGAWLHMTRVRVNEDDKESTCHALWSFIQKVVIIKSALLPCVIHIIDTITDIATCIEIYRTTNNEECRKQSNIKNGMSLFIISVMSMIVYRIISAYEIYRLCGYNPRRFISQFFDFDLLYCVFLNLKYKILKPSNPQILIQSNETLYESVPQAIIALYFLIITHKFNLIVVLSFIFSLVSVSSKISRMDQSLFIKGVSDTLEYYDLNGESLSFDWLGVCCQCKVCRCECKRICSWIYVCRVYVWRYCELLCRVYLITCTWVVCGGIITITCLICEYVILFYLYQFWHARESDIISNLLSALSALISTPFVRSLSSLRWFLYVRISFSVIVLCLCVSFSHLNFDRVRSQKQMDTWYTVIACLLCVWPHTPFWIARNHKSILSNSDSAGVGRSIQELICCS